MRTALSVVAVIAVLVGVAFVLSGCPKEQPPEGATPTSNEPGDVLAPDTGEVDMRLNPTKPMDINKSLYWSAPAGAITVGTMLNDMLGGAEEQ